MKLIHDTKGAYIESRKKTILKFSFIHSRNDFLIKSLLTVVKSSPALSAVDPFVGWDSRKHLRRVFNVLPKHFLTISLSLFDMRVWRFTSVSLFGWWEICLKHHSSLFNALNASFCDSAFVFINDQKRHIMLASHEWKNGPERDWQASRSRPPSRFIVVRMARIQRSPESSNVPVRLYTISVNSLSPFLPSPPSHPSIYRQQTIFHSHRSHRAPASLGSSGIWFYHKFIFSFRLCFAWK